jgi:tryptophan synthase beta chain
MPTAWYNLVPDLPSPPPPALHPGTLSRPGPDDSLPLFPMDLIMQEVTSDRYIDIPGEVLDIYRLWRSTPAAPRPPPGAGSSAPRRGSTTSTRASAPPGRTSRTRRCRRRTTTPSRRQEAHHRDRRRPVGHGTRLRVPDVRHRVRDLAGPASYDQKPYRRAMMEAFGATVHPSPSRRHRVRPQAARTGPRPARLARHRDLRGRRDRGPGPEIRYALGSVLNHVLMHQTIIGEEALLQMAKAGDTPDLIVGCTGGGSNFGGLTFPFLREKLAGNMNPTIRAVEPAACPSLTRGVYAYDFGDTAGMTPLMKMHTLGHDFIPDPIHAGGLRYHGMSPLISHVYELGLDRGRGDPAVGLLRRRGLSSPAPRASSRHPSRPMRSPPRSPRRSAARRPARRRSSSRRCAATACWTWPPTTGTSPATSSTTSSPTR